MSENKNSTSDTETITIDLQPFLIPIAIVLGAMILGLFIYSSAGRIGNVDKKSNNNPTAAETDGAEVAGDSDDIPTPPTQKAKTSLDDDAVKGNKDKTTVAVVEFSDFDCPFCAKFYNDTLPKIIENYVDNDKVVFVYRDNPLDQLHPFAKTKSIAAECAGEEGDDKYFDYHDKLYEKGSELSDKDALKDLAKELGLNTAKFNSCLDKEDQKDEVISDANHSNSIGLNGTPGFVVGKLDKEGNVEGEIISGAYPYETFVEIIEKYL